MLRNRAIRLSLACLALALVLPALAQKKKEDPNIRMVQGTVSDANGNAVDGAVVQLKNTKNLQIRSFITKDHGTYYFHNLDVNVDYELKAINQGKASSVKTLSSFDTRKQPVINLQLNP